MKIVSAILLVNFVGIALTMPIATTVTTQLEARACGNPDGPCYSDPTHVGRAYSPVSGGYSDVNHVVSKISEKARLMLQKAVKHHPKKISEKERLELEQAVKHHPRKISEKERLELEQAVKHHPKKISEKERLELEHAVKHHPKKISEKERLELEQAVKHHHHVESEESGSQIESRDLSQSIEGAMSSTNIWETMGRAESPIENRDLLEVLEDIVEVVSDPE